MMDNSEGVHIYWDGKQNLRTSDGNVIPLPQSIKDTFPSVAFEGKMKCVVAHNSDHCFFLAANLAAKTKQ